MKVRLFCLFLLGLSNLFAHPLCAQGADSTLLVCRSILEQLGKAAYDGNLPDLSTINQDAIVAEYQNGVITVNNTLYPLLRQWFGAQQARAALAFIVGHELHHHHRQQPCRKIYSFAGPATDSDVRLEYDADLGGLYYACVAGYSDIREVLPALLDSLYRHFQLPEQLAGYKSLAERKEAYAELAAKADTLSRFFLLGNVMMGMRQFDMAAEAYGHILRRGYKIKEVRLHEILAGLYDFIYPNGNQLKGEFIFPLELELTIGMNAIEPIGKDRSAEDKENLKNIIEHLDALQQEYPNYSKVQFYLAVCHALAGNTQKLMPLKNSLSPSYREKMELIQALAMLKQDSSDAQAKATLERMSSQAGDTNLQKQAAWNLQVLEGRFSYEGKKAVEPCPFEVENRVYKRKYGQNAAGIEWEENNNEQQIYSFWRKGSSPYTYVKSRIKFSATETKKLLPIGSNVWIMPECTRMMFESTENGWYRWDLFF